MSSRVIHTTGTPRNRGLEHGGFASDLIQSEVVRLERSIDIERFLAETEFISAIRAHTPSLLEEIEGISDGAEVPVGGVLALNLMDERWWWSQRSGSKCSVIAEPPVLAQTMDLPKSMDGRQLVLVSDDPRGRRTVVLTSAGMVGLAGASSDGLGVAVNALPMMRPNPVGLPVAFVVRGLLERRRLTTAVDFLHAVPHASGQHYALADEHQAYGFECSAGEVVASARGPFVHTNHPAASDDVDPFLEPSPQRVERSRRRFERLSQLRPIKSASEAQRALEDREAPICRVRDSEDDWMTFGAVVMDLQQGPELRVALGPPSETEWATFDVTAETGPARITF